MKRRSVEKIQVYLQPKEIFNLIMAKKWPYKTSVKRLVSRDRALMAAAFISAGRISSLVQGYKYKAYYNERGEFRSKIVGRYFGLLRENVSYDEKYVYFSGVRVVKRTEKVVKRYGPAATVRYDFVAPLKRGLYDNPYWDQLVPFAHVFLDYVERYAPRKGSLFPITRVRAWQVIVYVTGQWPHWFRAQAEHFYGHFLFPDTIKLSKFVKVVDFKSIEPYVGYEWREQLKDKQTGMDFGWIDEFLRGREKQ